MKAAILESDKVFTVSPYYAEELTSGPAKGVELDSFIRKSRVTGITNGMDVDVWSPLIDKYISANYDAKTVLSFVEQSSCLQIIL